MMTAARYRVLAELPVPNQDAEQEARLWEHYTRAWERVLASTPIDVDGDGDIDDDDIMLPAMTGRVWRA